MRFLVLLTLSACGFGQGTVYHACPGVPYFGEAVSEVPIDCKALASNVQLAASMLVSADVVPYGALHDFNRASVTVSEKGSFGSPTPGMQITGYYDDLPERIYLARDGLALLHEMLHHWEWIHGVLNTGDHPNWCAKGYGQWDCPGSLDAQFMAAAQSISLEETP